MIAAFTLWLPAPERGLKASDLETTLAEQLGGKPLRWAITACEDGRFLVEGAVIR